jgi:hypothetical protein
MSNSSEVVAKIMAGGVWFGILLVMGFIAVLVVNIWTQISNWF